MPENELHQQIGKVIAEVEMLKKQADKTDDRFNKIVDQLRSIDEKVTQHRTGWQTFIWLGWLIVGTIGIIIALIQK